jgi:hypothetical protein
LDRLRRHRGAGEVRDECSRVGYLILGTVTDDTNVFDITVVVV